MAKLAPNTRQHDRMDALFLIKFRPFDQPESELKLANLKDISVGGARFVTEFPPESKKHLYIELLLPSVKPEPIKGEAFVLRVHKQFSGGKYEVGIRFSHIREEDKPGIDQLGISIRREKKGFFQNFLNWFIRHR